MSRDSLASAIKMAFGNEKARTQHLLLVAAVNSGGIRTQAAATQRAKWLSDELDKFVDGFFGNPFNTEYFLSPDRFEDKAQKAQPKPVFSGCDAHSFEDLTSWLGVQSSAEQSKFVTWVKADLTFEGLLQTRIEPRERIRLQELAPDRKEPYRVISRIAFENTDKFPGEVLFNPGLNSIIGSRSSGKSALLAYVSHAVDPDYTIAQQVAASGLHKHEVGPGASITWADVANLSCRVEWVAPTASTGRIVFVPQNALYQISERPSEVTSKIEPCVFRRNPAIETSFKESGTTVKHANRAIEESVADWFSLEPRIRALNEELRGLGSPEAVEDRRDQLKAEIGELRSRSALTEPELDRFQEVVARLQQIECRREDITRDQSTLGPYVRHSVDTGMPQIAQSIEVSVSLVPDPSALPPGLELETEIEEAREDLLLSISGKITDFCRDLFEENKALEKEMDRLHADNARLLERGRLSEGIAALVKSLQVQEDALSQIVDKKRLLESLEAGQASAAAKAGDRLRLREETLAALGQAFNDSAVSFEDMRISLEIDHTPETFTDLSEGFNKKETSPFLKGNTVDLEKVQARPQEFLEHVARGGQSLNRGFTRQSIITDVLTATREVRFVAELDGDRIGGFQRSSMTPGKRALFALTLILAETDEPWPLLIDQPEDDLDSRSIYKAVVKDLLYRKKTRQIIMVSHDANLVIGADSEEVIVANRHGGDRPNKDDQKFAYLTGSLEHSKPKEPNCKTVLESAGIREHACDILDGGRDAFRKRGAKYRL